MLRCSSEDCEFHKDRDAMFNISLTVYADFDIAENVAGIEPRYFSCAVCFAEAEEVPDGED